MKRTVVISIVLLPILLSFLAGLLFWNWYIIGIKQVGMEAQVTNTSLIGFNTGTDKLYFGTLAPDGAGERKTTVVTAEDAVVVIKVRGALAQWTTVSENNIRLQANVPHDIMFKVTIPHDAQPGNYTGIAVIEYHKPWP